MKLGALVLAAGKGTRLARVSGGRPKPLLEVAGKPIVGWTLEWLARHGISSAWLNLHHRPEAVRAALGTGERFGIALRYSPEETLLGTAGAWRHLGREWSGTSLVVYGDNVMRFDLAAFLEAHRRSGARATAALFDAERHANTGIAGGHAERAADGRITGFREGGPPPVGSAGEPRLVNAGAYLLEEDVLDEVPAGFQDFGRDVFPRLAEAGALFGHVLEDDGFCLGLDTPARFRIAQRMLESNEVKLT